VGGIQFLLRDADGIGHLLQGPLPIYGGALTLGLGLLLDNDPSTWRRVMDNAAVAELQLEPGPRLLRFNETHHLAGLA
jgi:hypothetical protein